MTINKDELTAKRIDELIKYLPRLEKPGRKFIKRWVGGEQPDRSFQMLFPICFAGFEEFFKIASQPWWCDYSYFLGEAGKMLDDNRQVKKATLDQVKTMLTFCVRGERFCGGFWEGILKSGKVFALLKKLTALREAM